MICQIPSYKKVLPRFWPVRLAYVTKSGQICHLIWCFLWLIKLIQKPWIKSLQKWWHNVEIMWSFCENWIHWNFSSKRNFDIKSSKIELSSIRNLIQKACLKSSSKIISKCWILAAFPRSNGRKMSTDKLSQGNVIYLEVQVEMLTHL